MQENDMGKDVSKRQETIFLEGFEAYDQRDFCFYPEDTLEAKEWESGYQAAKETSLRMLNKKFKLPCQYKD